MAATCSHCGAPAGLRVIEPEPTVKFIDGEPPIRHHHDWVTVAARLKERPGVWAEVHRTQTRDKAKPACTCLRLQGCEATSRTTPEGVIVYARWPEHAPALRITEAS